MTETTLRIGGMTCGHCVKTITEALRALAGVTAVEVSLAEATARVSGSADLEALRNAVEDAGYTPLG